MGTDREILINNLIPEYQEAIDEINDLTDEEIDIIFEYGEKLGFPSLEELKDDLYTYIQDKIIEDLIGLEFIDEKDAYKFYDKYDENIHDFCVYYEFISREYSGTYYIYVDESKSFVERVLENKDEFSNWAPKIKKNINYLEIVNELNKNFDGLKFII